MKYKTWKCGICGETIIEGQRFIFLREIGFAHLECVLERLTEKNSVNRDLLSLIDANELITYSIIRLKESETLAADKDIKEKIISVRKSLEKYSVELSDLLIKYMKSG